MRWKIPKVRVKKKILSNSLRVVYNIRKLLTVTFRILSKHGYRNETFPESVHLLEHMLFKPEERVFPVFQKIGGDINGFVSMDEFSIHWNVPSFFQENAVEVVDRILNENKRYWTENMLEREKFVIVREIGEAYSDPKSYLNIFLRKKLFGEDAPGTHDPEVIENAFKKVTLDDIKHEVDYLSPDNSVLSIVGKLDEKVINKLEHWSGKKPKIKSLKPQPEYGVHVDDRDIPESFLGIAWISAPRSTVEAEVLGLLGAVLTAFPTSRLYRELRVKRGLVYFVSAVNISFVDTGFFVINTATKPKKVDEVINIIKDEIARIIDDGISENEVDDMKNLFFGALYNLTDSKIALSSVLAYNELFYNDSLKLYRVTAERVKNLRLEDVERVARKYLEPNKSVTCIVGKRQR